MSLKIGIVGLPNVGKSTLFNALTRSQGAQVANYPFCTIDPNVGVVEVPDERLQQIADIVKPQRIIPTVIEFVDIAGLVAGASKGEGLGNQFLSHIRECDAIALVIRFFEDSNIIHVHNEIDPKKDIETVTTELLLADLQTVTKVLEKAKSAAKSGKKEDKEYYQLIQKIHDQLNMGLPINKSEWGKEEINEIKKLNLLSYKPVLFIGNISESQISQIDLSQLKKDLGLHEQDELIPISAKIEEELGNFSQQESKNYLKEFGLEETGLKRLIQAAYSSLRLLTYFTAGPKEVRAWTVKKGDTAPRAAGVIHSDFEKGFIRADVYSWRDLIDQRSEQKIREKGLLRSEGKQYVLQDGDVMFFHFN